MAIAALGPTNAGGTQPIVEEGYELDIWPDVLNKELQDSGQAPVYYYMPKVLHVARKDGREDGDFLFNLIRFAGTERVEGVEEPQVVAGGLLTFSVSGSVPDHILKTAQQKIIDQYTGSSDHFWGIRTRMAPVFRPVIITSNITSITNVSPSADGTVAGAAPRSLRDGKSNGLVVRSYSVPPLARLPKVVHLSRNTTRNSNLNAWYWNVQGQGVGSIDVTGVHSYSALVGSYPANILWEGFHGVYSPINVWMNVKVKFWTPQIEILIEGDWDKIADHFKGGASGHYLWFSADIKAEFNKLVESGDITTKILVDPTIPNGEAIQKNLEEKSTLVYDKFMNEAERILFEKPTQDQVDKAIAAGQAIKDATAPWGVGLSFNYRRDETHLKLRYHEERQIAFLQDDQISGTMEGMFDAMKLDPDAERKYFREVFLDDWPSRIGGVVHPVVRWSDPIKFLAFQVAYLDRQGDKQWTGKSFSKVDGDDAHWAYTIIRKSLDQVAHPPENWTPDKTYIKRAIHFLNAPDPAQNPFVHMQIEQPIMSLDPDEGTLTNEVNQEVRAEAVIIGPIGLDIELESDKQMVEVTFEATDADGQPIGLPGTKFIWRFSDQNQPRFWYIFSNIERGRIYYTYQVHAIVKGSFSGPGEEWTGLKSRPSNVEGPLTVHFPAKNSDGALPPRSLPLAVLAARLRAAEEGSKPPSRREGKAAEQTPARKAERAFEAAGYRLTGDKPPAMPSKHLESSSDAPTARGERPTAEDLDMVTIPGRVVARSEKSTEHRNTTTAEALFMESNEEDGLENEAPPAMRKKGAG